MNKLYRVLYRYKGEILIREHYTPAKSREEAMAITRKLFGKVKITDCYLYN